MRGRGDKVRGNIMQGGSYYGGGGEDIVRGGYSEGGI